MTRLFLKQVLLNVDVSTVKFGCEEDAASTRLPRCEYLLERLDPLDEFSDHETCEDKKQGAPLRFAPRCQVRTYDKGSTDWWGEIHACIRCYGEIWWPCLRITLNGMGGRVLPDEGTVRHSHAKRIPRKCRELLHDALHSMHA